MLQSNVPELLRRLPPNAVVLDIGGWAQPFRRANYVMDFNPYDTRGFYEKIGMPAFIGDGPEQFTRETWIQRDICEKTPFPFADKSIDFVVCSHTLEDIRDPLWVSAEINRIGKAGYLEVPSLLQEFTEDAGSGLAGMSHHRWLVDLQPDRVTFEMKYHRIHLPQNHLPPYYLGLSTPQTRVQFLFWQDHFNFAEASLPLSDGEIDERLQQIAARQRIDASLIRRLKARAKVWVIRHPQLFSPAMLDRLRRFDGHGG